MPYSLQYKKLIESEVKVSKSLVRPRRIYKIVSYNYVDGTSKTFSGASTAYIFVTGVFDRKIYGLKLSEIRPEKFLVWLKTLFKKNLTNENFNNQKVLSDLLVTADKAGNKLYGGFLKGKEIFEKNPSPFRTYDLDGIKQITEIYLKKNVLMSAYGLKPVQTVESKQVEDSAKPQPTK